MSASEELAADAEPEPDATDEPDEPDDQPALADDEVADMDLSGLTESVQEEVGDATDESDDDTDAEETASTDASDDGASAAVGQAFGDMYVDTLAVILGSVVDEHGTGDDGMDAEEIGELARSPPFMLNENVDALAEEMAGGSDIPPGKAAVAMTALLVSMVLIKETDAADQLTNQLTEQFKEVTA